MKTITKYLPVLFFFLVCCSDEENVEEVDPCQDKINELRECIIGKWRVDGDCTFGGLRNITFTEDKFFYQQEDCAKDCPSIEHREEQEAEWEIVFDENCERAMIELSSFVKKECGNQYDHFEIPQIQIVCDGTSIEISGLFTNKMRGSYVKL